MQKNSILQLNNFEIEEHLESPKPDSEMVEVRDSAIDLGVFATDDIAAGDFIAGFYGAVFCASKASNLPLEVKDHAIQFSEYIWRDSIGLAKRLNHSCSPNCYVDGSFDLKALKNIKEGEELTWDYSSTEDSDWRVPGDKCLCGEKNCKGIIPPYKKLSKNQKLKIQNRLSSWLKRKYRNL